MLVLAPDNMYGKTLICSTQGPEKWRHYIQESDFFAAVHSATRWGYDEGDGIMGALTNDNYSEGTRSRLTKVYPRANVARWQTWGCGSSIWELSVRRYSEGQRPNSVISQPHAMTSMCFSSCKKR